MDVKSLEFNFNYQQTLSHQKQVYSSACDPCDRQPKGAVLNTQQSSVSISFQLSMSRESAIIHSEKLQERFELDERKPLLPLSPDNMREVARNVIHFIGQVIHDAYDQGRDESELEGLFKQAQAGVKQGFTEALSMFDEVTEDIEKHSEYGLKLIQTGIDALQQMLNEKKDDSVKGDVSQVPFIDKEGRSLNLQLKRGETRSVESDVSLQINYVGQVEGISGDEAANINSMVSKAEELTLRFSLSYSSESSIAKKERNTERPSVSHLTQSPYSKSGQNTELRDQISEKERSQFINELNKFPQLLTSVTDAPDELSKELVNFFGDVYNLSEPHKLLNYITDALDKHGFKVGTEAMETNNEK